MTPTALYGGTVTPVQSNSCNTSHTSFSLYISLAGFRRWQTRKLLGAVLKQRRVVRSFLSAAARSIQSCHSRVKEICRIDSELFRKKQERQRQAVARFLSTAAEQSTSCFRKLQALNQEDSARLAREERQRERVAVLLSTATLQCASCFTSLEQLNKIDSARYIEKLQAEAVRSFLSLSRLLSEDEEEDTLGDTESAEMSRLGFSKGKKKKSNELVKVRESRGSGQKGWEEENCPIYENIKPGLLATVPGTKSQPEGYILLTSPPPAAPVPAEGEDEEAIYDNLADIDVPLPESPTPPMMRIHSVTSMDDDIMMTLLPPSVSSDNALEEEEEGIYENMGLGPVDQIDEIYDTQLEQAPPPLPPPRSDFNDSDIYVDLTPAFYNPPTARVPLPAPSQHLPADHRRVSSNPHMAPLDEESEYVDVTSPLSSLPPSFSPEAGEEEEGIYEDTGTYEEEGIYEDTEAVQQYRPGGGPGPNVGAVPLPSAVVHPPKEQASAEEPRVSVHYTGNSPMDSEDYVIPDSPVGPPPSASSGHSSPGQKSRRPHPRAPGPSPPPVPCRSPTTKLTTVLPPNNEGGGGGNPRGRHASPSSPSSSASESHYRSGWSLDGSEPSHGHSRLSSSNSEVFVASDVATPPASSSKLGPRQSRRRSGIKSKAKSTSSVAVQLAPPNLGPHVAVNRKLSSPVMGNQQLHPPPVHKPLSKQASEPIRATPIHQMPLPPIPTPDDFVYDYADLEPESVFENPPDSVTPHPYTPPIRRRSQENLLDNKDDKGVASTVSDVPSPAGGTWIDNRPPALPPNTLSRNRPPAPLPSMTTPTSNEQQSAKARDTSPHNRMPAKTGSPQPSTRGSSPQRSGQRPARVSAPSPPMPYSRPRNEASLPSMSTGSATPHISLTGSATPHVPPSAVPHVPSMGGATPPVPQHSGSAAPPPPPLPPLQTGNTTPPPLQAMEARPPPLQAGNATPPPPPPPVTGGGPPPPPPPAPPPPMGGVTKYIDSKREERAPPTVTPSSSSATPLSSSCSGNLLAGITSVQLKKASERPLPQQATPTSSSSHAGQGGLMAEMQSFKLKKRIGPTPTKPDSLDAADGDAPSPHLFHVQLRPTSSLPVISNDQDSTPSAPARVPAPRPRQGRVPPPKPPRHQPGETVPEWKRALLERKKRVEVCVWT